MKFIQEKQNRNLKQYCNLIYLNSLMVLIKVLNIALYELVFTVSQKCLNLELKI